jgi:hypothetical protein
MTSLVFGIWIMYFHLEKGDFDARQDGTESGFGSGLKNVYTNYVLIVRK